MRRYIAMPWAVSPFNTPPGELPRVPEVVKIDTFPDGETAITLPDIGQDDDVVLVGSCPDAQSSESFLAAAYEIAHAGPARFTVANLYFRNARCERKFGNQAILAKFQARLWSGLGSIYPKVRLVFLHLHNDLALNYFEGPVRVSNVPGFEYLESKIPALWGALTRPVYATVDHGGVHETRKLADAHAGRVGFAHIDKKRLSGTETEVREVHGNVMGCDVVIFDDMISTGGSLIKAAQAYKDRGARRVFAVAVHGLFVNGAAGKLPNSAVDGILVTNSHPQAMYAAGLADGFIRVVNLEPDFLVSEK